jgi:hypothetical protein
MVTAAVIFILSGLAYASWALFLALTQGPRMGLALMALVSAALCYQGYALLRQKRNARLWGIVSALALAVGSGLIALMIWSSSGGGLTAFAQNGVFELGLIGLFVACVAAAGALFASSGPRPNNRWRGREGR